MTPLTALLFVLGLALLVAGAELLVRGASRLAAAFKVPPLIIGLTVVAYGTSMPELAISVNAAWSGSPDIALGNVLGSNIFNVLLILGLSALVTPLVVSRQLIRLDVPIMIGVSLLALGLALDGRIGRMDGVLLFAGALIYTTFLVRKGRREGAQADSEFEREYGAHDGLTRRGLAFNAVLVLAGLGLLVLGSRWFVDGAVSLARWLGLSDLVIGLTIVAAGTSMPEVATSVIASLRGERDIAVGNVVGSNIFNLLAVLGLTGLIAPEGITVSAAALGFDFPVMIAVALACLPIFYTDHLIARWEGALFLGYYLAYSAYLILRSAEHAALGPFSLAMGAFVLPLTAVTLAVLAWRAQHREDN